MAMHPSIGRQALPPIMCPIQAHRVHERSPLRARSRLVRHRMPIIPRTQRAVRTTRACQRRHLAVRALRAVRPRRRRAVVEHREVLREVLLLALLLLLRLRRLLLLLLLLLVLVMMRVRRVRDVLLPARMDRRVLRRRADHGV